MNRSVAGHIQNSFIISGTALGPGEDIGLM